MAPPLLTLLSATDRADVSRNKGALLKFYRSVPFRVVKSFSRRRYLQDQAELNRHYWTSRLCIDITSKQAKKTSNTTVAGLLGALQLVSPAAQKLSDSRYTAQDHLQISERWLRLTTILIASSAFERYLVSVCSTAVQSDPALTRDWPKRVDGLTLKKYDLAVPTPSLDGIVKGDWNQRVSAYRSIFRSVPPEMQANVAALEAMRKMRNGVAHEFGYDNGVRLLSGSTLFASLRLSQSQLRSYSVSQQHLIDWLAILNKVAKDVDRELVTAHIGGYELAAAYLSWQKSPDDFEADVGVSVTGHRRDAEVRFRHVVGQLLEPLGDEYFRTMKDYISAL